MRVQVAHIRQGDGDEWVLFNDEKVVEADMESVRALGANVPFLTLT